jgi:hypothetical protein
MTIPSSGFGSGSAALEDEPVVDADELRAYVTPLARAILFHALLLGVSADLLMRDGPVGLGYAAWLLLLALATLSLVWRGSRRLPRETAVWLTTAIVFGAGLAWRDAGELQFLDFAATLFALGMAAIALGDPRSALFAARMRDTIWAGAAELRSIATGFVPLALRDVSLPLANEELRGRVRPALRALLIALPLLLVFGSLLRGADPVFASILALPELDFETIASHVVPIAFFTWVVAGWARGALIADLGRRRAPERLPLSLGMLDVTTALGVLNVLFALYVLTQLGWFFGGERFLQARTGLTAAEYARQGFFQMVWVVLLVVPLLLGTRAALRPGREVERRHTALALPLIALLGVMILSAMLRMRLYVHYFGLTTDRLYPLVFMGWLAVVLAWLALTVLRDMGRPFAAGAVMTGLATLAALNVAMPDVIVARVNVARANAALARRDTLRGAQPLDLPHLAQLSGEAVPYAVAAVLAPPAGAAGSAERADADRSRCQAASLLLRRWQPSGTELARREADGAAWRRWNRGRTEGERVVATNAPALRAVQHAACPRRPSRGEGADMRPVSAPVGR